MAFKKAKATDYFLLDTNVENMFINEYMVSAPGDYVKVYLFALMYAGLGADFTNEDVAKQLGLEYEDVLKAWSYWEKMGVIAKRKTSSANNFDYDVEFLSLKEHLYGEKSGDAQETSLIDEDIDAVLANKEVRNMLSDIEKSMGRVISGSEMSQIISWITDYGMSPEIILRAVNYSCQRKKGSINYIAAVVSGWATEGLNTIEAVDEYLGRQDQRMYMQSRVFKALGFNRNATEEEVRIMNTWFDEMGFSLDKVLEACKRTAGISSPNLNYVNKVLQNWREEGERPAADSQAPSTSEIMAYYEMLRAAEEAEAAERCREVFGAVPRIKEIDDEVMACSAEMSKIIISDRIDKKEATAKIKEILDALNAERAFLLTDNGYELDYMDIRYNCQKCKDTGILETGERCQCFGTITKEQIKILKTGRRS